MDTNGGIRKIITKDQQQEEARLHRCLRQANSFWNVMLQNKCSLIDTMVVAGLIMKLAKKQFDSMKQPKVFFSMLRNCCVSLDLPEAVEGSKETVKDTGLFTSQDP